VSQRGMGMLPHVLIPIPVRNETHTSITPILPSPVKGSGADSFGSSPEVPTMKGIREV